MTKFGAELPTQDIFKVVDFEDATPLWADAMDRSNPMREEEDSMTNHSSSLFKLFACPRRYYWDRTDPIDEGRDWRLTAAHGNAIHEMLVDIIKRSGRWRGDEVRGGVKRVALSYRIDCLFWDDVNVVPVEIKSARHRNFVKFVKEPNRSHILQLQSYLHFHKPAPYPYGYLLYYDKDEDVVAFLRMRYDPVIGAAIEEKLAEIEECIAYGELPTACDEEWECRYCPYGGRCDEIYAASKRD